MFQLIIASIANQTRQILKSHMVASVLINSTCFVKSTLTTQEVLGVVDERPATGRANNKPQRFPHASSLATPEREEKSSLDTLKLDHLSSERQRVIRQMMSRYFSR